MIYDGIVYWPPFGQNRPTCMGKIVLKDVWWTQWLIPSVCVLKKKNTREPAGLLVSYSAPMVAHMISWISLFCLLLLGWSWAPTPALAVDRQWLRSWLHAPCQGCRVHAERVARMKNRVVWFLPAARLQSPGGHGADTEAKEKNG